jgi:hypothetical protein
MNGTAPKAIRLEPKKFRSESDYKLHEMACDQIDAGQNCDFYIKKYNTGWVKMPDGTRKQYFMR